jgi:SHS family lactate transporter-like MFS transporter
MAKKNEIPWWKEPTRAQWAAFVAAWSGWVLDAFDFTIFLLVAPLIAKEMGASDTVMAGSVTLTLLVRLAGGYVAGWMADRWGRKLPLMISVLWFAVCDFAIAFAPTIGWILALRTLFGLGMGAEWTAGATLAMESWPERSKKVASGLLQAGWPVGYFLAAAVSALVVPAWGWRALFLIAAVPALLVLPIRFWVKESPEWLQQRAETKALGVTPLWTPRTIMAIASGSVVMALGFAVYYGLVGNYPTMLAREHGMGSQSIGGVLIVFNIGMLLGAIAAGAIAQRRGLVAAVVVPALAMVPLLPLYVGIAPGLLHVGAFLGGAVGVGFCGVVPALLTGLFDADVRARAVGVVYHVGAFLASFVPLFISWLAANTSLSLAGSIAMVAGVFEMALAAAFVVQRRAAANVPAAVAVH